MSPAMASIGGVRAERMKRRSMGGREGGFI